jgi:hypothetical protein
MIFDITEYTVVLAEVCIVDVSESSSTPAHGPQGGPNVHHGVCICILNKSIYFKIIDYSLLGL